MFYQISYWFWLTHENSISGKNYSCPTRKERKFCSSKGLMQVNFFKEGRKKMPPGIWTRGDPNVFTTE